VETLNEMVNQLIRENKQLKRLRRERNCGARSSNFAAPSSESGERHHDPAAAPDDHLDHRHGYAPPFHSQQHTDDEDHAHSSVPTAPHSSPVRVATL
jgi:hypothetical protein